MGRDEKSVSIDLSTNVEMMARLKKWGCFIVGDSARGTLAVSLQQDITLAVAEGEHILPVLNNDHADPPLQLERSIGVLMPINAPPEDGRRQTRSAPVTHQDQGCGRILKDNFLPASGNNSCPRKLSVPRRVQGL
jgi:hypothetical protein